MTVCTPASCTGGKVTTASVCNGSGSCTTTSTNGCGSNLCAADGMTCAGSCTATSCGAGTYCGAGGACAPTIADGKTCSADNQCTNGHCVSGVCCNTTCGACHSCSTGTCKPVAVATTCTASGGGAGVCDSTGTCNACSAGTSCTTGINTQCQTGAIDCSTGTAVCKASNKNNGTACGNGPSCTGSGQKKAQDTCSTGMCAPGATSTCTSGTCNGTGTDCGTCPTSTPPTGFLGGNKTICPGTSTTVALSGGSLGSGATWQWYSGSNHTGAFGRGQTMVTVTPSGTTTYTVRAEGPGQCAPSGDASTTISVTSRKVTVSPLLKKAPCNDGQDRGVFTVNLGDNKPTGDIIWWVSYVNDPQSGPYMVDRMNNRYLVISPDELTLSAVPQDSVELWVEVPDGCSNPSTITSNHVKYLVPTYDPDTGVCTPVP